jgi:TonB family protein
MNRIFLDIACLVAISIPAFAQLSASNATDRNIMVSKTRGVPESTRSTQDLTEYAPLDNAPFFPGGQRALETYLRDLCLYPNQAWISQREGIVQVQFRVKSSGELTEIRIVQSFEPLLNQAIVRAVALMPRWYPAHRAGMAVSSLFALPVTFRID